MCTFRYKNSSSTTSHSDNAVELMWDDDDYEILPSSGSISEYDDIFDSTKKAQYLSDIDEFQKSERFHDISAISSSEEQSQTDFGVKELNE